MTDIFPPVQLILKIRIFPEAVHPDDELWSQKAPMFLFQAFIPKRGAAPPAGHHSITHTL